MSDAGVTGTGSGKPLGPATPPRRGEGGDGASWLFVYVFFTNGIPFDAPNRSEPCPRS